MKITYRGIELEVEVKTGFTVHNQDGTSYVNLYLTPKLPPSPNGPGGGEPLPVPKVA
jgi:hypothetical protein